MREEEVLPRLVRARELAGIFRVQERSVYRWASAGRIPKPLKLGGTLRWRLDQVKAFLGLPG